MLYLIGGAPRVGKSTLASLILERNKISVISTDVIRNLLDYSPAKIGVLSFPLEEQVNKFFPFFFQLLKILQNKYGNYVVEGDLFTPGQLFSVKERIGLKCCFLGTSHSTLEDLRKTKLEHDWVSRLPKGEQSDLPEQFVKRSEIIKHEAGKYSFPYFDIYPDRKIALERAYDSLFKTADF